MRIIWIDPQGGKHHTKPTQVDLNGRTYAPPTDDQLAQAGWVKEEIIDPVPEPYVPTYAERVEMLIRERYTIADELAIQRQRDTKPAEFAHYFAFCEECKRIAKEGE